MPVPINPYVCPTFVDNNFSGSNTAKSEAVKFFHCTWALFHKNYCMPYHRFLAQQVTVRVLVEVKRRLLYPIQKSDAIIMFVNEPNIVNKTPGMTYKCLDPRWHSKFPLA